MMNLPQIKFDLEWIDGSFVRVQLSPEVIGTLLGAGVLALFFLWAGIVVIV